MNLYDYYNQRDNCLDKLTTKTHVHDNVQTTRSLIIVRLFNPCSVTQGLKCVLKNIMTDREQVNYVKTWINEIQNGFIDFAITGTCILPKSRPALS